MLFGDRIVISTYEDEKFEAELLFGTESALYIWTSYNEFDSLSFQFIEKIEFSDIKKLDLRSPISWHDGIKKVLPFTLVSGAALTLGIGDFSSPGTVLLLNGLFNFVVSLPVGAVISLVSNTPNSIKNPSKKDFSYLHKRLHRHFLLNDSDMELISKIISEIE